MPKEALRCGNDLIGHVSVTGGDMFWLIGTFVPGPEYTRYQWLFEREQELRRRTDEDSDDDEADPNASDNWIDSLEEINNLNLTLGERGQQIRDFKIFDNGQVEFKFSNLR